MTALLSGKRGQIVVLFAIFLLAAYLGFHHIGSKSLWDDEAFSVAAARLPLSDLWTLSTERDPHTFAYHLFLHAWIAVGGNGETWVRALSVVFSLAGVAFLWLAARRLFGVVEAHLSALLLAITAFFIQYQQEARPYAFALMLVCLSTWMFARAVQAPGNTKAWIAWGISAAAIAYSHPFALGAVAAQALAVVFVPKPRPTWRQLLGAVVAFVLVISPLVGLLVVGSAEQLNWVAKPDFGSIAGALYLMSGHMGAGATLIVVLTLGWFVVELIRRRKREESAATWSSVFVLLWIVLLPAVLIAVSFVEPVLVPRYLIPCLPAVVVAVAVTILRFHDRLLMGVVLVALLASSQAGRNGYYSQDKDDWRTAANFVAKRAQPGDGILFLADHRLPFEYYYSQFRISKDSAPTPISPTRPWLSKLPAHEQRADLSSTEAVERTASKYKRVWWVLIANDPYNEPVVDGLAQQFGPSRAEEISPNLVVRLYGETELNN